MTSSASNPGKSLPIAGSHQPTLQPSGQQATGFEFSRRSSQASPSFSQATPRKGQRSRKQHRNQRRPGAGDTTSGSLDEFDPMSDLTALRNPSSRRGQTSITHLLNYSSPRAHHDHSSHARSYRRYPTWGGSSGHHAAEKARYVHANYRFVVSSEGSYSKHAADADLSLDWSLVLQVIASAESQPASCPICLSEPTAPRMARCGHIFCLPCLIRFMNSSSNDDEAKSGKGARWKKCPICEECVYLHEVRPVRFYFGQEGPLPREGDDVVLRLMARNANSTLALPRESGAEVLNSGEDVPWHFAANVLDYARIIKGTKEYMLAHYDEEVKALVEQEREDEMMFGSDGEWTQKAIRSVEAAKERLSGLASLEAATSIPSSNTDKQTSEADFHFYSALPHLYLSPLDIRILKTKYGSFSSFPSTLLPRVDHISTGHVVDDAMRRKAKYLGHLPRGCIISFLECDWTDIVPTETLRYFAEDIERRRRWNRDKAVQEERERAQAERLEAAALHASIGPRRMPEPVDEEPSYLDPSEFQPLNGPSRATPPDPRPGFATLASMSTSPTAQRTIWGTPAVPTWHESPELETASAVPPVSDGWLKEEEYMGAAELTMQMEALGVTQEDKGVQDDNLVHGTQTGGGGGDGGGGSKKRKKQKITLMSTGGRRGN